MGRLGTTVGRGILGEMVAVACEAASMAARRASMEGATSSSGRSAVSEAWGARRARRKAAKLAQDGKLASALLRIEKLEKYRMQDLKDIDMRFGMQKKSLEEVEFKLEAIKEQMGEYLPKAEFYALSGAFVQEDRFKFFEEAVEVNYLPRTRIMKEIESLWVEVKNSKEYVSSNFLSAKEQKQMLERKLEASKANYVEAKRFKKYENQIATQLASHTTRLDSFPDQLDELHERMKVVTKKLERKANEDELQQTVEYMRQLPQNKDLVELYNKTVPQLGIFQKIVTQYSADQRRFERVILRFDEDISLKASKMSLRELSKHVEDKYLLQTEIEKSED